MRQRHCLLVLPCQCVHHRSDHRITDSQHKKVSAKRVTTASEQHVPSNIRLWYSLSGTDAPLAPLPDVAASDAAAGRDCTRDCAATCGTAADAHLV